MRRLKKYTLNTTHKCRNITKEISSKNTEIKTSSEMDEKYSTGKFHLTDKLRATRYIVCSENLPNKPKVNFLHEKLTAISFYEVFLSFNQIKFCIEIYLVEYIYRRMGDCRTLILIDNNGCLL